MLSYAEDIENKVVEVTVAGSINKNEFNDVSQKIEQRIQDWGKLRLLKRIDSFTGIEPTALFYDLKFGFEHFRDFLKVAVVSDKEWVEKLTKLGKNISPCEVRFFENEDIDQARAWLR